MAFSAAEKTSILFYLGYSGFEDDGPAMRALNSLDNREQSMGPIIRETLDRLAAVDRDIFDTRPLAKAVKVGAEELRAHYTLAHLWTLGRSYVTRLARFTKIQVCGDVFGSGGSERGGDNFFSGDPAEKRVNPSIGMPTTGSFGGGRGFGSGGTGR